METPQVPERKNNERLYLIIIAILTLSTAILAWQLFETRTGYQNVSMERNNLETERNDLKEELNSMLEQYDKLKTDNKELSTEMQAQKDQIKDLLEQIEKNKGNVSLIAKYRREVVTLRTVMKSYVVTIDSLNTVNKQLFEENLSVKSELGNVRNKADELAERNAQMSGVIAKASVLRATQVEVNGIRLRSNGKQQETDRAKNCEIFRVCFKISENKTSTSGPKTIYLRVIDSSGGLVTKSAESVVIDGAAFPASAKKDFDYHNEELDMCIYAHALGELQAGSYTLQLIESKTVIATKNLSLK